MKNEIGDGSASLADFRDYVRAIQADALQAAADTIEGVSREGRDFAPKSFWATLSREQGAKIRSLIPSEATP